MIFLYVAGALLLLVASVVKAPDLTGALGSNGVANAGGRTLAVVKVLPGGAFEILQDSDEYPLTVTFPIIGGLASYAVIAY